MLLEVSSSRDVPSYNATLRSSTMLAGSVGAMFLALSHAHADTIWDEALSYKVAAPSFAAVDGVNGKVDGFGGSLARKSYWGTKAAVAIPLAGSYGFQLDGAAGKLDHRGFGAVGGHLFWRNPAAGLIGLYVSHANWNSLVGRVRTSQVAAEGAWYWGRWSVEGVAGVEFGNSVTGTVGTIGTVGAFIQTIDIKTRFFDQVNVSYYWQDNLRYFVGHRYLGGKNAAAFGLEWAAPVPRSPAMVSLFVEGRAGEYTGVWGGLKLYVGKSDKPLIRRHREDDPIEWNPESTVSGQNNSQSTPAPNPKPPKEP